MNKEFKGEVENNNAKQTEGKHKNILMKVSPEMYKCLQHRQEISLNQLLAFFKQRIRRFMKQLSKRNQENMAVAHKTKP